MVLLLWASIVGTLMVVGLVVQVAVRVDRAHQAQERVRAFRRDLPNE